MENKTVCQLCKIEETTYNLRMVCLGRDKELYSGYYKPKSLTMEEKYKLPNGESWICVNRRSCFNRQIEALK